MSHPADYATALQRGTRLLAMLDDPATPPSPFTNITDLVASGWTEENRDYIPPPDGCMRMYNDPSLRLTRGAPHHTTIINLYKESITLADLSYFKQTYNIGDGSIFIIALQSPISQFKLAGVSMSQLPALRNGSDVTFLMWQKLTQGGDASKMKGLKRIVHAIVSNEKTKNFMRHVLELGERSEDWMYPGHSYTRAGHEEHFTALLGTPNAMGTAFLLAQHRVQLGGKKVLSIQVFRESEQTFLVLNLG